MKSGSADGSAYQVTPVSAADLTRVVSRALAERPARLRLTSGQRLAILNRRLRPRAARA